MGAQCQPGTGTSTPIPAGTYRGTIGGQSQLLDQNNQPINSGATQSTITLVVDATGKPVSMSFLGSGNAPAQTLTTFTVGGTQRFQYTYNDPQNGQVNVDYTAQVTRSEQTAAAYVVEYTFNGTQTSALSVTGMFGQNSYQLYNQDLGVWVTHNQSSTLTPSGGQGLVKSTLFETGLLPKAN
jgi:hypothetical protein